MNNLSLVNIFGEAGRFFYKINYMLSLANKIGDKTEFTITRVHCNSTTNSCGQKKNYVRKGTTIVLLLSINATQRMEIEDCN